MSTKKNQVCVAVLLAVASQCVQCRDFSEPNSRNDSAGSDAAGRSAAGEGAVTGGRPAAGEESAGEESAGVSGVAGADRGSGAETKAEGNMGGINDGGSAGDRSEAGDGGSVAHWVEQNALNGEGGPAPCMQSIAVGANDVPWTLGCDALSSIFYLSDAKTGDGPRWLEVGGSALELSLNINGQPWINKYGWGPSYAEFSMQEGAPSVSWVPITTQGSIGGSICMIDPHAAYSSDQTTGATVVFDNRSYSGVTRQFWALGCDRNPFSSVWTFRTNWRDIQPGTFEVDNTDWTWIGMSTPLRISRAAVFTDLAQPIAKQNVWLIAEGGIYFYVPARDTFLREAHAPKNVTSITDHHLLAGGVVYTWNGDAFGDGDTTWTPEAAPPVPFSQIAWSQALKGTVDGVVGPSRLWAIDFDGRVYFEE